jgi:hypothetical protein
MKASKIKKAVTEHKKTYDFKCKSRGVSSANDFYIFEGNENRCERRHRAASCRGDEAVYILPREGAYPV